MLPIPKNNEKERKNAYTCENLHITVTKDIDKGTTSMMIECPVCGKMAASRMYMVSGDIPHTHEWYKPSDDEKKRLSLPELDHVNEGGLLLRDRDGINTNVTHVREAVREFAVAMELKLRKNDHKDKERHWSQIDIMELYSMMMEEANELFKARAGIEDGILSEEAVDVANFAMMIWDNDKNT